MNQLSFTFKWNPSHPDIYFQLSQEATSPVFLCSFFSLNEKVLTPLLAFVTSWKLSDASDPMGSSGQS